ncbi:glycosyltransferase [Methylibium sp.]|uniref:glycosyltransferase n=1 Tax=Methylibium sp. TaxID=2067992 RepID=UPI003D09B191
MRILNVISSVNPIHGGPAEGIRQYAQATRTMGHTQEVLTLDAPDDPWVRDFPTTTYALGPVCTRYAYTPRLVPWLKAHAAQFDAVVVHGLWQYHGFAVWRALRGSEVPYFVFFHGMLDPWFKRQHPLKHLKKWLYWPWADYRVARDAKAVLFTAQEEALLAPKSFWLYRVNPAVIGYGLALSRESSAGDGEAFFAAFPQTRGKRIVLFLSRIHPKKGCDLLIEAFSRVARADPTLQLVMAGPDSAGLRAPLERRAAALGMAQRITWTGMLQGELKWAALQAAEVFALLSHQENFGIAVAEALAMGVPVLISRQVNIWREIVEADAGFAAEDTVAGATTLLERWLLLSPAQRDAMRRAAADCYQRHFHIASAAERFVATLGAHLPPPVQGAVQAG